jgi:hypothetical protein
MDLAEVHEELVAEIRDGLGYVAEPAHMADLGDIFDTLSLQLEGLGLCHLFEFADQAAFRENMIRSGHSRRFFLRRSRSEKNEDDRHLALSRNRAFLDAVVGGSLVLARDIARLSTETWNPAWEYEDDFCFYLLLHTIAQQTGPFPRSESHGLLKRFEESVAGGESPHLDVARALVAKDPAAFADSLLGLLGDEAGQIENDRDSAAVHEGDVLFWPKSRVSIEGLALLNVADLLGISVQGEFPLCPSLARLPWNEEPVRDVFEEIEALG